MEYKKNKTMIGNEFGRQKGGSSQPQFQKSKGHVPCMPVHLRLEIEVSLTANIHINLRQEKPNPKEVWHKEIVGFLHIVNIVKPT